MDFADEVRSSSEGGHWTPLPPDKIASADDCKRRGPSSEQAAEQAATEEEGPQIEGISPPCMGRRTKDGSKLPLSERGGWSKAYFYRNFNRKEHSGRAGLWAARAERGPCATGGSVRAATGRSTGNATRIGSNAPPPRPAVRGALTITAPKARRGRIADPAWHCPGPVSEVRQQIADRRSPPLAASPLPPKDIADEGAGPGPRSGCFRLLVQDDFPAAAAGAGDAPATGGR